MQDVFFCPCGNMFSEGEAEHSRPLSAYDDSTTICPDCHSDDLEDMPPNELLDLLREESKKHKQTEQQFCQERERAQQYRNILRKLVEAQDEIDVEADEKSLHERSAVPMVKKTGAIKEARRALGGE